MQNLLNFPLWKHNIISWREYWTLTEEPEFIKEDTHYNNNSDVIVIVFPAENEWAFSSLLNRLLVHMVYTLHLKPE